MDIITRIAPLCFLFFVCVAPSTAQVLPLPPTPTIAPPAQRTISCGSQETACPIHLPETYTVLTLTRRIAETGVNCCARAKDSCAAQLKILVEGYTPRAKCRWCSQSGCKPELRWPQEWWKLSDYERYGFGLPSTEIRVFTTCEAPVPGDWGGVTCKATCRLNPDFILDEDNCPTIACSTCGRSNNSAPPAASQGRQNPW